MKSKFIDRGIPVIMCEFSAYRRGGPNNIPLDQSAHNNVVDDWDTGGALDRRNNTLLDQRSINALIAGTH
ncbi:hypothetical protein [Pedobacter sp. V48]|uniref:hypothetical protein n=1 Tax=Pedobacter sp. V48 TaxID=509635 RepID=UPI0003E4A52D|nr:hypothetical protein [Pedobacter sp. V48]ETZ24904.1 hypothetical protein N824_01345 [Pedobacter sp. V48]